MNLYTSLDKNKSKILDLLPIEKSFDMVGKDLILGQNRAYLVFIDGLIKDDIWLKIFQILHGLTPEQDRIAQVKEWMERNIGHVEVSAFHRFEEMQNAVLAGAAALIFDQQSQGVIIDLRTYPVRGPQEPDLEKVTRGSRDGLVETIVFNTALIRRRLRDPSLIYEMKSVGKRSKTDLAIGYIDDLVDKDLLQVLTNKIEALEIDALMMAEKSLEELLFKKRWYNPLPQARFTERPDVVAAHLLEGHIALMVDTSPSVLLLPVTLFHFTQHSEDYYQNPFVGTYIRWVRFIALISSVLLTPLWLLLVNHPELIPVGLEFIGPKESSTLPIFVQFLFLEVGLDTLRIASIHTPSALSTSLGIIGGLILSQFAIDVGWFLPETVLYMAIVGLATFCSPSIEFAMANRLFRLFLLITTGLFGLLGFALGLLCILFIIGTTKTIGKVSFLWPLIPFNGKALSHILFRKPVIEIKRNKKH